MPLPRVWATGVARAVKEKAVSPGPRVWHLIDARAQVVGRLAKNVAELLTGKHKPTHVPRLDGGDHVVVINAAEIEFTGRKWTQKMYRHHTGWMGGLKETLAKDMLKKFPERILEYAVKGMLPKNKLRKQRMMRLHVFPGATHTHGAELDASYQQFGPRWRIRPKPSSDWYPKLELPPQRSSAAEGS